ncbi:4-galactosyl-N-acetylglucosaminide 3-alpha-L-fucosyltransferase 9-like [Biomphalaria glabrata]|uniref:Fucosyltransferase n=1 Tax=Biomphalaria glabrata TaxID=6526 RepID=A0A9U8EMB7_BIOGL|nr:4-galactosyl-N-acetylglucosaminide 3-alpha-L-fucosyltransferase 9-like [Biomphalaria glabrata]
MYFFITCEPLDNTIMKLIHKVLLLFGFAVGLSTYWRKDLVDLSWNSLKIGPNVKEINQHLRIANVFGNESLANEIQISRSISQLLKTTYLNSFTQVLHEERFINKTLSEYVLRSSLGLEPYTTENHEDIWIENGVQYRPYQLENRTDNPFSTSEFQAYVPFNKSAFFEADKTLDVTEKKIILWWQDNTFHTPTEGLLPLRACPEFPCVITSNRTYTENSSALIFNGQYVEDKQPPNRAKDQIWIFYQIEAPYNYFRIHFNILDRQFSWNAAFNWTMSYRMDSDIVTYYGIVRKRREVKDKKYKEILGQKKGLIAWVVSHCHVGSKRDEYVQELKKYVPVDIYGGCGTFKCSVSNDKDCIQEINAKYKFYLAFENNFCKDYITEKLYKYLDGDMIIIARGYNSYSKVLPSETFINTANYKSPKELAERILYLDTHDEDYLRMLKEKDQYFAVYEEYPLTYRSMYLEHRYEAVPMCQVCQRLWNLEKYSKSIKELDEWFWKKEYQCQVPTDI